MRKMIPMLLVAVLWLNGGRAALADGMMLPLPEAAGEATYGVAVRHHHVTVSIDDEHAVTRVEQEFYNPHDVAITGRYLFPVPPDAILSGFWATVDGQQQDVIRQDAEATNAELYAFVAHQHDPSLLQYADWESIAFDLDLPPGGSRAMALEYEEVMALSGGLYHYRYVLSTERYSSLPLFDVSVTVDLSSSRGLSSVYSSRYAVDVERRGAGRARVTWQAQQITPGDDFELFFAPADSGFGGGLLTGAHNGQDHLLFSFSPEGAAERTAALPKDLVLVIDRSGSMSGTKIDQARSAMHYILDHLEAGDRFSIIAFDERLERLSDTLLPGDDRALEQAHRFVDRLSADGSTDLHAALQAGLEILARSQKTDAPQMIVFLTDGLPTAGLTDDALIASAVAGANAPRRARLHVFGVGYDVNTHLLDRLAAENGGTVTYVQPGENLETTLTGFYTRIASPLLTDVSVKFEGMAVDDLYPDALPDLFQGSSLLLAGRFRAISDTVAVRIRGRAGDEWRSFTYRFSLAETGGHDFVPRLWATRHVGALLDRVRVQGETDALVEEIRGLGLAYGIVTPYTTFIVEGQGEGAASAANMELYNRPDLNSVSGQTTVQARVQNQMYQQAEQANLAYGANVSNIGSRSLAQVGAQQVDLTLLQELGDLDGPLTEQWLERNVQPDRTVEFGSEEYFRLAADPAVRPYLQSGANTIFAYEGQTIAVRDEIAPAGEAAEQGATASDATAFRVSARGQVGPESIVIAPEASAMPWFILLAVAGLGMLVLGSATLVAVAWRATRARGH
jgi:Ca-activated chloride channel family protein